MGALRLSSFLCLLFVNFLVVNGQIGLQVDSEKGFPLRSESLAKSGEAGKAEILNDPTLEWRLPTTVIPTSYDLTITPVIDPGFPEIGNQWEAPGTVDIYVRAVRPTSEIILHSVNISITKWEVTEDATGATVNIAAALMQGHGFLNLTLDRALEANKDYIIHFEFVSLIKDGLDGLYRSSYIDPYTNTRKYLATTQMEALHARQMFPCFDEPSFKAIFYIKIGRRDEHVALTNERSMRNETMTGFPGWKWETFYPTPKMSTYLLALIISEFTYTQSPDFVLGKPVRTYAPKHYIDREGGVYAADKADRILQFFQTYYAHPYPLSKMDSAAVPDFFFGAMENYGLNIYRETALLYFPDESTEAERYSITSILAHELGHQWFGDLVSPSWWTHIWLNEGFATYVAAQGMEEVAPEFQPWERFQTGALQYSMGFDAQASYSHSVKIDENEWIKKGAMDWFDRMAYEKAGSVIRMMNGFLTEPVFKAAILTYLKAMEFSTAVQDDLFDHLNVTAKNQSKIPADLSMHDIMNTWTLQPGFPLLRVSVAGVDSIFISQERFINNEDTAQVNQDTGLWYVPMSIASKSQPSPVNTQWIYKDIAMQSFTANTNEWVVVNSDARGYYRVIYDAKLTQLIKQELETNHSFISSMTRSQILDDYFNAAWQKYTNVETALSLASYLGNEQEVAVWNSVFTNMRKPFNLLSNTGSYDSLRSFLLPRIKSATTLTGGVNATLPEVRGGMPVIRHLQFLDWLCALEDPECLEYSTRLVNEWKNQPNINPVRRDIKPVVYCSAVASGTDETFTFIKERYQEVNITAKQVSTLLNALACTKEISLINSLLEGVLVDGYYLTTAHGATILQRLAMNVLARGPLIRFLRTGTNTEDIITRFGTSYPITNAITTLSSYVSSQVELADIEVYLQEKPVVKVQAVDNALATIRQNIIWAADFGDSMSKFFKTR